MRVALLLLASLSALAAGRELAPRPIGPTPYHHGDPQTAFAGGRFLTVWNESRGEVGHSLMGMLSDASGRRISGRALVIQEFQSERRLVGAGNLFALFWNGNDRMHLSNIDVQGNVTGTKVLDLPASWDFRAASNGERFFLATRTGSWLLDRSGAIVATFPDMNDVVAISPFDGGLTVVTSGLSDPLRAWRVANDGTVGSPTTLERHVDGVSRLHVIAAPTPTGTLVVWAAATPEAGNVPGSRELRSAFAGADGSAGAVHVLATRSLHTAVQPVHLSRGIGSYLLTFAIEGQGTAPRQLHTLALHSSGIPQPPVRTVAQIAESPSLAAASNSEATLAVFFVDPATSMPRLQSIAIGSDGNARHAAELVAIEPARQTQPALADAGSRLLAAWTEQRADDLSVRTASLRTDGSLVSQHTIGQGELASHELPWNGFEGIVLFKRHRLLLDTQLYAGFIGIDGAPLAPEPILLGEITGHYPARPAAAVWAGDRWLVAWPHALGRGIQVAVVRNGAPPEVRTLALDTTVPENRYRWFAHVALARNATNTLLVWTEELRPSCAILPPCGDNLYRTYAARLTPGGEFAGGPLGVRSGSHSLSVATSGDEFVILADGTAAVVDAGARRILRTTTVFNWDAASDVTWNGSAYVVALRYRLMRWYLATAHLDRAGNLLGTRRGVETLAAETLAAPGIAGSFIAVQEGDAANGARAVVYDQTEQPPLPPPPPSPLPRITLIEDSWYEITWDPVPGAELYVVESDTGDSWRTPRGIVRADLPLQAEMPAGAIRVTAVGPGGASTAPPRRRASRH